MFNDMFNNMFGGKVPRKIEATAPNGQKYTIITNLLDEMEAKEFENKLKLANNLEDQELFEKTWAELVSKNNMQDANFDEGIKNLQDQFSKIISAATANLSEVKNQNPQDIFSGMKEKMNIKKENYQDLSIEELDKKIQELTEIKKIKEEEKNKLSKQEELNKLKKELDDNLLTLSELTDEKEKAEMTEKLSQLYKKIKELEK